MTPQPQKPRVLIVDDREGNRMAYAAVLSDDYTLSLASNGLEALDHVRRREFAVILLDIRMPEMGGHETAEELRKLENSQNTPIIFMSAYDQDVVEVHRCYVAGATDFISSPVDSDLLRFKVAAYAQLFLKNEALRIQIRAMANLVQQLQIELSHRGPTEKVLRGKVEALEEAIDTLKRELTNSPL